VDTPVNGRDGWRSPVFGVRLAAAVAALLLAAALVIRFSVTLTSHSPTGQASLEQGGVWIDTDAGEAPLFPHVVLEPGDTAVACVGVMSGGLEPGPVDLRLGGYTGSQALAESLLVTVEEGRAEGGGGAGGCGGFVTDRVAASGSLAQLLRAHGEAGEPIRAGQGGASTLAYRVTATLPAGSGDEIQGHAVTDVDLHWVVTGAGRYDEVREQLLRFAGAMAEENLLPLLVMTILAVLFLGIQDRIDRRDPKLAAAPVTLEALLFEPVAPSAPPVPARR
jgi:hypothetical protein